VRLIFEISAVYNLLEMAIRKKKESSVRLIVEKVVDEQMYEIMAILPPALSQEKRDEIIEKSLKERIASIGGEIRFEDMTWGERKFAYPVKKHEYGYYVVIVFTAMKDKVGLLEEELRIDTNVLRSLTVKIEEDTYVFEKFEDRKQFIDFVA
jgi:small subunit ribosomal protein S6